MDQTIYEVTSPIRFDGKEHGIGAMVSMTSEQAKQFAPCLADPAAGKKTIELAFDGVSTQRIAELEEDNRVLRNEVDVSHRTIERQSQQLNQLGLDNEGLKGELETCRAANLRLSKELDQLNIELDDLKLKLAEATKSDQSDPTDKQPNPEDQPKPPKGKNK